MAETKAMTEARSGFSPDVLDSVASAAVGAAETSRDGFRNAVDRVRPTQDELDAQYNHATGEGQAAADALLSRPQSFVDTLDEQGHKTAASVGGSIMVVARGVIVAVVALIVLGALYNTDIVANPEYNNSWTQMFSTFADYGTTAFTLIGVGLIAVGAGVALSYFGGLGGSMGGR